MSRCRVILVILGAAVAIAAQSIEPSVSASGTNRQPGVQPVVRELVNYGARNAFAYVSDDGRAYTADAGTGPPRARGDRFRIGSVTKTFVAAIVLQLAEERKLRLDDPVGRYLPGTIPLGNRITLRQLLNHTSGLANYTDYPDWLDGAERSRTLRPLDVLTFAAAKPRAFARPGGSWSYSNTNYAALGLVIETVTGRTLAQELARRISRPLQLRDTELARTRSLPDLRDERTNPNVPWAAGGVVSSSNDLARFFAALLSGRIVSRASLDEMQQTVQDPTSPAVHYGLGLERIDLPCGTFWGNAGRVLDYSAYVTASEAGRRVAVVFLRGRADRSPDMAALLC